jgi:hypothetical protein
VNWSTVPPDLAVVAARSPLAEWTFRVSSPLEMFSTIQRGLSPSPS